MYNSRQLMFQIGALRVLLKCIHFAIFEPAKFSAVNKWIINKYINNDLEVAHPQSGSLSSSFLVKLEFGNVGFWGEGKPEYRRKISQSKGENQQQTQPTYGLDARIWTQATLVGSERSHHCAIPCSPALVASHGYSLVLQICFSVSKNS